MNNKTGTRYAIVGLGATGLACIRYLSQQGVDIAVTDSRAQPPGLAQFCAEFPNIPIKLGGYDHQLLAQAQEIILSPGVSRHEPAIARCIAAGIPVVGDIELFARCVQAPVVAITGSNGKGTVTTLLGEMAQQAGLKVKLGGNIGTPVLDLLPQAVPDYYILELSSFQLESTFSLHSHAAVILNLSPDHLDRYTTMAAYLQAKQTIYRHCQHAVINRDNLALSQGLDLSLQAVTSFGLDEPPAAQFGLRSTADDVFLMHGSEQLLSVSKMKIKGQHNWSNALAALALGQTMNLEMSAMLMAVKAFAGLPHRCQWVAESDGVVWYDDSKGTNIGATQSAIQGLGESVPGKVILIAGGQAKGASFTELRDTVRTYVRRLILLGEDAELIAQVLEDCVPVEFVIDLKQAVQRAQQLAQPGDVVLLSPACASFDMFRDYVHRGEAFTTLVQELVA